VVAVVVVDVLAMLHRPKVELAAVRLKGIGSVGRLLPKQLTIPPKVVAGVGGSVVAMVAEQSGAVVVAAALSHLTTLLPAAVLFLVRGAVEREPLLARIMPGQVGRVFHTQLAAAPLMVQTVFNMQT
jgi:hypothetical protein